MGPRTMRECSDAPPGGGPVRRPAGAETLLGQRQRRWRQVLDRVQDRRTCVDGRTPSWLFTGLEESAWDKNHASQACVENQETTEGQEGTPADLPINLLTRQPRPRSSAGDGLAPRGAELELMPRIAGRRWRTFDRVVSSASCVAWLRRPRGCSGGRPGPGRTPHVRPHRPFSVGFR